MPYQMPTGKWRGKRMIHGQVKTKVFLTKLEAKKWEAGQTLESWIEQETQTDTALSILEWANSYMDYAVQRYSKKTIDEKRDAFKALFASTAKENCIDDLTPQIALKSLRTVAAARTGNAANKARKNLVAAWFWGVKYMRLSALNPFHLSKNGHFVQDDYPQRFGRYYIK